MVLSRDLTYRSMEQNKESRNRPTHVQLIDLLKKALNQFNKGKESFFPQMVLEQLNNTYGEKNEF